MPRKTVQSPLGNIRLWWSVTSHTVQFALPKFEQLLPRKFRAKAISSLLPLRLAPLPALATLDLLGGANDVESDWQPLLPGSQNVLIVGVRPGVPLLTRHFIVTQSGTPGAESPEEVLSSGVVPVQVRGPRPIPIPSNDALKDFELPFGDKITKGFRRFSSQPWASYFSPRRNHLASVNPRDEGFLGLRPPLALRMELVSPTSGNLDENANGDLVFVITTSNGNPIGTKDADWNLTVELINEGQALPYSLNSTQDDKLPRYRYSPVGSQPGSSLVKQVISGLPAGALIYARVTLVPNEKLTSNITGYRQTLLFPLRVSLSQNNRPPLEPVFVQFEDPEYNRRLASQTAHVSRSLPPIKQVASSVTLATDRREYNPTSELIWILFGDKWPFPLTTKLRLRRLKPTGEKPLIFEKAMEFKGDQMVMNKLDQIRLADLKDAQLLAGDTVLLCIENSDPKEVYLELRLDIVAEPVIPAPEAAYALLRGQPQANRAIVECVRFAWGPSASRIELIDPTDLMRAVVRRRAVFHWTDTKRSLRNCRYAVQKISHSGSTHFFKEFAVVLLSGEIIDYDDPDPADKLV
jgi:hypothetical protein